MDTTKCPLCGTSGKEWNKEPQVYECRSCSTLYSEFGLVMESQQEQPDLWS
ncbi:MAG: hypothetical protein HY369_02195 [Candidatus Aenigmarchaeota archaeon]|nr:hypothetical protein [Candidatus Aenigmarchaeota archaeon]